jgi:hypothetical protein
VPATGKLTGDRLETSLAEKSLDSFDAGLAWRDINGGGFESTSAHSSSPVGANGGNKALDKPRRIPRCHGELLISDGNARARGSRIHGLTRLINLRTTLGHAPEHGIRHACGTRLHSPDKFDALAHRDLPRRGEIEKLE